MNHLNLLEILNSKTTEEIDRSPKQIRASSIGHPCIRNIWYEYNGYPSSFSEKSKFTLELGKSIENIIIDLLKSNQIMNNGTLSFKPPEYSNNFHEMYSKDNILTGHYDAIIFNNVNGDIYILEIKSAKNSQFNLFKSKGLKLWNYQYYLQVQSYLGLFIIEKFSVFNTRCIFLVFNKDTSELHQEIIEFDDLVYEEIKAKAKSIINTKKIPDKIHESSSYYVCKMCKFNSICHQ